MKELEQLHSREVEVISAFSGLINNEQTSEISEIFLSCYSSTRTYDKLIGCWEEKYEELVGGSHRADNIAAEVIQVINSNTLEKNLLQQNQIPYLLFSHWRNWARSMPLKGLVMIAFPAFA
jgi:hypothetical protein